MEENSENSLDIDQIPEFLQYVYKKRCTICDYESKILTQMDYTPEYRAEIYVQCQCGAYIFFSLPVN